MIPQPAMDDGARLAARLGENVARAVIGKESAVELLLVALICEGHVLLEDVPGVGKTLLAKAVARSLGLDFRRIQFTPDLLPSDITGSRVFNQCSGEFEFRLGPLFANVILADEINRATPRTQSALLEAMEERQVTADGVTMPLPRPFLVLATQNPIELEGTFPLPEARLRTLDPAALVARSSSRCRCRSRTSRPWKLPIAAMLDSLWLLTLAAAGGWAVWAGHSLLTLAVALSAPASASLVLWRRFSLTGVHYARRLDAHRVPFGATVEMTVELVNLKPLPLTWLQIEDTIPRRLRIEGSAVRQDRSEFFHFLTIVMAMLPYERVVRHLSLGANPARTDRPDQRFRGDRRARERARHMRTAGRDVRDQGFGTAEQRGETVRAVLFDGSGCRCDQGRSTILPTRTTRRAAARVNRRDRQPDGRLRRTPSPVPI
jgi:hypothetical protein